MKGKWFLALLACAVLYSFTNKDKDTAKEMIGKQVADFGLYGVNGKYVRTKDAHDAKGFIVVFSCNHCPFAKLYTARLNELSRKYEGAGMPLLVVNSMDSILYEEETLEQMKSKAREDAYIFPYLQDPRQEVAKLLAANRTPQAFVLWREAGKLVVKYAGSIDDNGEHPEKATPFLANAVDELLAGKTVRVSNTPSLGCRIYYRK